jgi:septation ring formation regulator EzrA
VFFDRLEKYRSEHGDCNVLFSYPDQRLAGKVKQTRKRYKKGKISPEVIARLNQMGFVWNTYEETWEKFFELLEKYRAEHGDCNVPSTYPDQWLAGKVKETRQRYKKGKLFSEIIDRLNQMGFVWNPLEENWEKFFELLEKYRSEHGDCNVPQRYPDKWLARKVSHTRKLYKQGKLSPEVIERLNQMGFVWVLRKKR